MTERDDLKSAGLSVSDVETDTQTAAAEVEALAEALSSPGFVNAITDAVDGAFRNPPPPSTLHDDAHTIAIADAAVGAARDYLLASDWLAAHRAHVAAALHAELLAWLDDLLDRTHESILSSGFRQEVVLASDLRAALAALAQAGGGES